MTVPELCFGIPDPIKWIRKKVFVNVLKHLVGIPWWEYLCGNTFVGVPVGMPWPEYLYIGHMAKLLQEFGALLLNSPHLFMA